MSAASPVAAVVVKEIRATWLVFAGCFAAMALPRAAGHGDFGEPAYLLGAALLGALAIGHEYSNRTLVQALAQPMRRAQLLAAKLGVLAVMLAALGAVAWVVLSGSRPGSTESGRLLFLLMPPAIAFCVGPWLTMVSRGPLAGAVFSCCLPGLLWFAALLTHYAVYRREPSSAFAIAASWRGGFALCAVGAVMTWRTFLRLEAIEGPGREVHLPLFRAAATTARRHNPLWVLLVKDFRLQQMTLAIVALYCVAWPVCVLIGGRVLDTFYMLSLVYGVIVALVSGSLSSAEERQLGTFEPQMLLPVPVSRQWLAKVAVVLAFTLVAGIGLPYVLMTVAPASGIASPRPAMLLDRPFLPGLVAIASAGLYVSSLSTSGVRAVVAAAPSMLLYVVLLNWLQSIVFPLVARWRDRDPILVSELVFRATRYAPETFVAACSLLLIALGYQNHRSGDRSVRRIAMQVIVLAALGILFTAAMSATPWMRPPITPFRR